VQGVSAAATVPAPADNVFATASAALYAAPPAGVKLPAQTVQTVGGMAHPNLQPFQVMTMAIALQGVFPSKN
jgi:microcystin-dependent protein